MKIYQRNWRKARKITGEYHASLLDRFDAILEEKRPYMAKKSAFPPRPCNSSHECHCNCQIIWFTLRNTSSSTLFPRFGSFRLFFVPNMKTWLGGKRFSSNEEIIAATNEYFERFDKNYFLESIKEHEYRYNKCIQLKGDYVKKQIGISFIKTLVNWLNASLTM